MKIKIPASTANLGPGFDVMGAGLSLYLELTVEKSDITTISYSGLGTVPLDPKDNFICQIAVYVANAFNRTLPHYKLHINNPIPLGRGLGSSGSAIIGAIAMADQLLGLKLSKQEILDYAVIVEGHPDNVAGSLFGSFVTCFVRCPLPKWNDDWCVAGSKVPTPMSLLQEHNVIGTHLTQVTPLKVNPAIKCVAIIPEFTLLTSLARSVLPDSYSRQDIIFNMSRLNTLTFAIGAEHVEHQVIYESMQDKIHQSYRAHLVPGLSTVLQLNPTTCPGLAGICLSGAGPTVLVLATDNLNEIGTTIVEMFKNEKDQNGNAIESRYLILDFDKSGLVIQ
ncbi:hypothetical protein HK103_000307 [Boothiomyces macroporosus]|uniref:Homoserine kinase n=1 Tax=Boothiomyces macroporosus TaxID=261099 RepID=A0AAD5Y5L1_9FUNG|nr:hypothetical protein HK103_000285 [Boothiomyces macroporosus]KAJ3260697.1 hypothetical protein HK103_000307 [Boothiomyces macroporosus]